MSQDDDAALARLVGEADVVVSLLPPALHVSVARAAIAHRVPLVTTSYVSPAMNALDGAARKRNLGIAGFVNLQRHFVVLDLLNDAQHAADGDDTVVLLDGLEHRFAALLLTALRTDEEEVHD